MCRPLLSLEWWCMNTELHLLFLFSPRLLLAKLSPRLNSLFAVFLPSFHVFLHDFLSDQLLLSFMSLLSLVSCIQSLEVMLSLFNLLEELLAHVLHFLTLCLFWKGLETLRTPPSVLLLALTLDTFLRFTHDSLVHPTLLAVHQSLVCLL